MGATYKIIDWQFDSEKLAGVLKVLTVDEQKLLAEYLGVSNGGIWHWRENCYPEGVNYPNMSNFLKLCDALDLDPREFFVLAV